MQLQRAPPPPCGHAGRALARRVRRSVRAAAAAHAQTGGTLISPQRGSLLGSYSIWLCSALNGTAWNSIATLGKAKTSKNHLLTGAYIARTMVRAMLGAAPAPKPPMDRSKSFVTKEEAAQVKVTHVETVATILGLAKNKSN